MLTHGHTRSKKQSPTYSTWRSMINRCTKPYINGYENYGGRGIRVCESWLNSFENFLRDMGFRPNGMEIGRKDNNGDYTKSNCEWQSRKKNGRNKRTTLWCLLDGKIISCAEACEILGVKKGSLESYLWKRRPNVVDVTGLKFRPRPKLTPEDVRFIRSSNLPRRKLAAKFAVSPWLIQSVKNGKCWKNLP